MLRHFPDDVPRGLVLAQRNETGVAKDPFVGELREIDLGDEYQDDMAGLIEKQITKRDHALATRFLYESGASPELLDHRG